PPRPRISPLFPYTTLFRSSARICPPGSGLVRGEAREHGVQGELEAGLRAVPGGRRAAEQRVLLRVEPAQHSFLAVLGGRGVRGGDRKSTRLNSSHVKISYA